MESKNLGFKPKIPESFSTAVRNQESWIDSDLGLLMELRAISVSFVDCGKILKRRPASCTMAVSTNKLYEAISKKRKQLINNTIYLNQGVERFEVIDHTWAGTGRMVNMTHYDVSVELSYQDDGKTLKVFLKDKDNES